MRAGHILVWDLEKKKLITVVRHAHEGTVHSLHFLTKEPVLVSAGTDNALKMWIFDQVDGTPRLLRSRQVMMGGTVSLLRAVHTP
jgi:U3 small nucleolar RNA-associated protein 21